jgi:hypothetical protein
VVVESGTCLGVLVWRRVVRRREPTIGHGCHGSEPPVRPPAPEPDLRRRVGYRREPGLDRIELAWLRWLAAHQGANQA